MKREEFEVALLGLRGCKKHAVNAAGAYLFWTSGCVPNGKCRELFFDFILKWHNAEMQAAKVKPQQDGKVEWNSGKSTPIGPAPEYGSSKAKS